MKSDELESHRIMYHTQEKRDRRLIAPIICNRNNAWLGDAFYFWDDEVDAIHWGKWSKKTTGSFEVYESLIDCNDVLDTVFNETHYNFWKKQLEKVASEITKRTHKKATKKEVNNYIKTKAKWDTRITGILFQDLPYSVDLLITDFPYRKKIQLAVYNLDIVKSFDFSFDMAC